MLELPQQLLIDMEMSWLSEGINIRRILFKRYMEKMTSPYSFTQRLMPYSSWLESARFLKLLGIDFSCISVEHVKWATRKDGMQDAQNLVVDVEKLYKLIK